MSTTSTDPADIEADLERERASLASTLDALSDRVSVDNMARQALDSIKSHAGSYGSSVDAAVRSNPFAVALIGAGVAWLLIGKRSGGRSRAGDTSATAYTGTEGTTRVEAVGRSPEYGSVAYRSATSDSQDDEHGWFSAVSGLRERAMAALRRIESDAKSYYQSATSGSGGRDYESERSSVISSFTSDLKARLSSGLEGLSEASRTRVIAARERTYAAGLRAETARAVVTDPGRMMEEHPIVAGAVAFALGAAAGAALPRTDAEDRAFGSERDRLMDEAASLLRSERQRAMQVAGSLGQELKAAAMETVEAVADTAAQKAQEAAGRVGDRAAEELGAATSQGGQSRPDPVIG